MATQLPDDVPLPSAIPLETLRTEIRLANAELEIRLTKSLASKSAMETLTAEFNKMEGRLEGMEKWQAAREPLLVQFQHDHGALMKDVENLKTSKASEEAVKSYKRWILGGGSLVAIIMVAQFLLGLWVVMEGSAGG